MIPDDEVAFEPVIASSPLAKKIYSLMADKRYDEASPISKLEASMRYDVIVALVFATKRVDEDRYDVWDIQTPVEADNAKKALLDAIILTKGFEDWKVLGYPDEPVLCGIRSVHSESRLGLVPDNDSSRLPILVGTITERQVESLRSFDKIFLPYCFMHIG